MFSPTVSRTINPGFERISRCFIVMRMTRTTVDVDERALDAARRELGTEGLSETVNAALRDAARRRVLKGFDVVRDVDGTPQEVAAGRERS